MQKSTTPVMSFIFMLACLLFLCGPYFGSENRVFADSSAQFSPGDAPLITEFMASNDITLVDEDGDYSDWIEIHNPGLAEENLGGWYLTDDASNRTKWQFPDISLGSDGYLVIFASDKDRAVAGSELHLNFKLSSNGEYLALVEPDGITVAYEYAPEFPAQRTDISYGTNGSIYGYFLQPTPGAVNDTPVYSGFVSDPVFSIQHGFFNDPFQVELSTGTAGAQIKYTLDGSSPSATAGIEYTGPISVDHTTVLRAMAFFSGYVPSTIRTRTYIFIDDVIAQSPNGEKPGPSWPNPSGPNCWTFSGQNDQNIDYGMDPEVVNNPDDSDLIDDALLAIPTMSLVTDLENLFDPSTGIYVNAQERGREWERPASLEMINPDGSTGFQVNAGVRIRGGVSRFGENAKHAFRFYFRSELEYGDARLQFPLFGDEGVDEFEKIDLRTSQNMSWAFCGFASQPHNNTLVRDIFCRYTQKEMGQPYTRSRYYHLYINGHYWGLYQTQERAGADFAESYFGGIEEDYDTIKTFVDVLNFVGKTEVSDGNRGAWDDLIAAATDGFELNEDYFRVQGMNPDGSPNPGYEKLLDIDNIIDYMILIYYSGTDDAPITSHVGNSVNNFYAIYNRNNPDGFKFFVHDNEYSLDITGLNFDRTGDISVCQGVWNPMPQNCTGDWHDFFNPQTLHQELCANAEYRLRFADRVHKHFFNNGAFDPDKMIQRFNSFANTIEIPFIAESARWGDSKDGAMTAPAGGFPFTRDAHWLPLVTDIIENYLPYRTAIVLDQFKTRGWYPMIEAPLFNQQGGEVPMEFGLTMECSPSDTIYYTLDGSDPRMIDNGISPTALEYDGTPVMLTSNTVVMARSSRVNGGLEWSALNETIFIVGSEPVIINEIMYNPAGDDAAEFLELYNPSLSSVVDISGWTLDGIGLTFPESTSIPANGYLVVARDAVTFAAVYGAGIPVAAVYEGALDNGGEVLTLLDEIGQQVDIVDYSDDPPWPEEADGDGPSLELNDPTQDNNDAVNWSTCNARSGTPGVRNIVGDACDCGGDLDNDGDMDGSDLAEFATGSIVDLEVFANGFGRTDCLDYTDALFAPDHLIQVDIEMAESDWDILRSQGRSMPHIFSGCRDQDFEYDYFQAIVTIDGQRYENVAVRKKGFLGSLSAIRPSLKLHFAKYPEVEGRTHSGMARMTLNNDKQDPSHTHQSMAYALFLQAGLAAPRCNHAQVRVNGTDFGIYSNVEPIKKPFIARHFVSDDGNLYEGNGGADFVEGFKTNYERKTNELDAYGQPASRDDLDAVTEALSADDAQLYDALDQIIDMDKFLSFWAMEVITGHWDGCTGDRNNHYIYNDPTTGKFHFIPWGTDGAFSDGHEFLPSIPNSVYAMSTITNRLYAYSETREQYRERLQELLDTVWDTDALLAEVDRIYALAAGDAEALQRQRDFISTRQQQLQAELDNTAPEWPYPAFDEPRSCTEPPTVSGTFRAVWGDDPFAFVLSATSTLDLNLDPKPSFAGILTAAGYFQEP
ncbi:MAG: CotH kinase family protein, partial [Deltaproteobacteria bacterium]|nr:CotH kinase family protein [Deltaproteobacteria bacterium]